MSEKRRDFLGRKRLTTPGSSKIKLFELVGFDCAYNSLRLYIQSPRANMSSNDAALLQLYNKLESVHEIHPKTLRQLLSTFDPANLDTAVDQCEQLL